MEIERTKRPERRVLRVTPLTAELWDGPASEGVVAYEFAKARLTGAEPNLGENHVTDLADDVSCRNSDDTEQAIRSGFAMRT